MKKTARELLEAELALHVKKSHVSSALPTPRSG